MNTTELLQSAITTLGRPQLATALGVSSRTITRWVSGETTSPDYLNLALRSLLKPTMKKPKNPTFTFIDLFAGIGGIRRAFQESNGTCVFSAEWDKFAQQTYTANYGAESHLIGDIRTREEVPDHDILLAGFPCQPFSLAGVSKKNALGRPHGFDDPTQGTLFFEIKEILKTKRPRAFVLENVKNLTSHDSGRTFKIIMNTLTEELGYHVHYKVIDAAHFTPQHRERIIIVGFREATPFNWDSYPQPGKENHKLSDVLHKTDGSEPLIPHDNGRYFDHSNNAVREKYTLSDKLWNYLQNYAEKHRSAGNGFGFGLVGPNDRTRTLSARYHKDGSEILIRQDGNPRRLTPRECARLMGFDDDFVIPVSDTQAYKQFGNSVVVPVFKALADLMVPLLANDSERLAS